MLMKCPECELQVSDKALVCPHCGYPVSPQAKSKKISPCNSRHRRLPNGFGRITEIKTKPLRKPFRVMVTVGKDSRGNPIGKLLKPQAYFETYNEAYQALVEYNKNPYDLEDDMTIAQLYEEWFEKYKKGIAESSVRTITSAWAYCSQIQDMRVKDLKARHIKGVMETGKVNDGKGGERHPSAGTKGRIKSLFNMMLDYAVEYEVVDRNVARSFIISEEVIQMKKENTQGHMIFSQEEMSLLWSKVGEVRYINVLLIQIYSGWRPQELGLIRLDNVDLDKWTFIGGMKTKAGSDRLVPIHPKIRPLVKELYDEAIRLGSNFLINCTDTHTHRSSLIFSYDKYQKRFIKIKKALNLHPNHRPHDGRKMFVHMCKTAGVDEYAIKYMVGHAITDITEAVYAERKNDVEWLQSEISKI